MNKLELALANKNASEVSNSIDGKNKVVEEEYHNFDDLLMKIGELEKAAIVMLEEIDKLVKKIERNFRDR